MLEWDFWGQTKQQNSLSSDVTEERHQFMSNQMKFTIIIIKDHIL